MTAPLSTVLHVFPNPADGVEARVAVHADGYSVTLRDTDAGAVLPTAIVLKTEARAIEKAKEIAGLTAPSGPQFIIL